MGGALGGWVRGAYSHIKMKGMLVVSFREQNLWIGTPVVLSRNLFEAEKQREVFASQLIFGASQGLK